MNPIEKALVDADASLTENRWGRGRLFSVKNNVFCICAHGAIQAQVNPMVKSAIADHADPWMACEAANDSAHEDCMMDYKISWLLRDENVSKDKIQDGYNVGNLEAHYILAMVGLTAEFNDDECTTFQMVKEKFQEAIKLSRELGV